MALQNKQIRLSLIKLASLFVIAGTASGIILITQSHAHTGSKPATVHFAATTAAFETPILATPQTTTPNQNVEKVPELGVSLTLPDSIKDLTYHVSTVTLKNGQSATLAAFSTLSLAQLDSSCSAANGALGSLEMASGQYPSNDPYAALDYGKLVKQFPTFYIAAGFPNAACSTNTPTIVTASSHKNDFSAAQPTIQVAN